VQALQEKKLRAAVLDVTEIEPLPSDSILYSLPTVLITNHCSIRTPDLWEKLAGNALKVITDHLQDIDISLSLVSQPSIDAIKAIDPTVKILE